jgi:hypothetical protein
MSQSEMMRRIIERATDADRAKVKNQAARFKDDLVQRMAPMNMVIYKQ